MPTTTKEPVFATSLSNGTKASVFQTAERKKDLLPEEDVTASTDMPDMMA